MNSSSINSEGMEGGEREREREREKERKRQSVNKSILTTLLQEESTLHKSCTLIQCGIKVGNMVHNPITLAF